MAEPLWTSAEILAATGGRLEGGAFEASGVSIDTRTLEKGDLFVALAGERDGHEFVQAALAKGASGVLVSQPGPGPGVAVDDTLKALERLGVAARDRARIAASTNSWPSRPPARATNRSPGSRLRVSMETPVAAKPSPTIAPPEAAAIS